MEEGVDASKLIKPIILKAIVDKNEEKRRYGRIELERLVYQYATRYSPETVETIIDMFWTKFLLSNDANRKTVGLQVMTSIMKAVQGEERVLRMYDRKIVGCILHCLRDNDPKIRLATIKVLFQITRMLNDKILPLFNLIFERLLSCISDVEEAVRESCSFLNSALRNIVLRVESGGSEELDFPGLVNILKRKMKTMNLEVRRFLLSWIRGVMELDLYVYFPDFLEDLLLMISEKHLESDVCECLVIFESILKEKFHDGTLESMVRIEYIDEIVSILVKVAKSKSKSYTKLQTLIWLQLVFIFFREQVIARGGEGRNYFKRVVVGRFDEILEPILVLMSNEEEEVRRESINCNDILMEAVVRLEGEPINFLKVIPIIKEVLSEKKATNTSEYAMSWMKFMLQTYNEQLIPHIKDILLKIMEKIYDSCGKNIYEIIDNMKMNHEYFLILVQTMLDFLLAKGTDNESKLENMVRKIIAYNHPLQFLTIFCQHINHYQQHQRFVYDIANTFNAIIVAEEVMHDIRKTLSSWQHPQYKDHFIMLYQALKFSPPAAISLCLLSHQYHLALKIIGTLSGKYEISPKVLMGLCKVVSLLEKPAFVFLRLAIVSQNNEVVLQCLNELLMILPQGKIFNMLRNRLDSSKLNRDMHLLDGEGKNPIDIEECFQSYQTTFGLNP